MAVCVEFGARTTFVARTSAPISILSYAHLWSHILSRVLARSKYTRVTRTTEEFMRDFWITARVNWRKGRRVGGRGIEVGSPRAKSTVSIVVLMR